MRKEIEIQEAEFEVTEEETSPEEHSESKQHNSVMLSKTKVIETEEVTEEEDSETEESEKSDSLEVTNKESMTIKLHFVPSATEEDKIEFGSSWQMFCTGTAMRIIALTRIHRTQSYRAVGCKSMQDFADKINLSRPQLFHIISIGKRLGEELVKTLADKNFNQSKMSLIAALPEEQIEDLKKEETITREDGTVMTLEDLTRIATRDLRVELNKRIAQKNIDDEQLKALKDEKARAEHKVEQLQKYIAHSKDPEKVDRICNELKAAKEQEKKLLEQIKFMSEKHLRGKDASTALIVEIEKAKAGMLKVLDDLDPTDGQGQIDTAVIKEVKHQLKSFSLWLDDEYDSWLIKEPA